MVATCHTLHVSNFTKIKLNVQNLGWTSHSSGARWPHMFRSNLISAELDYFHHCGKFCWVTLICGILKIQVPQDSNKFRTLPVWGCHWSGNTRNWKGGQKAEQDEVYVAIHYCSCRWPCLIQYAIIHPPSQPLLTYFWLLFFTGNMNTNISHGPKKATLHLYMFQIFARDGTLLFRHCLWILNNLMIFFTVTKTIKGKQT